MEAVIFIFFRVNLYFFLILKNVNLFGFKPFLSYFNKAYNWMFMVKTVIDSHGSFSFRVFLMHVSYLEKSTIVLKNTLIILGMPYTLYFSIIFILSFEILSSNHSEFC